MRILIVDDDAIVLESCRRILEAEEIEVHAAADAGKAQDILETEGPFDLMLTDIKMPGQDGFQLIRLVTERFQETAVLMMTGYLIPETIQKGRESGADAFIAKPFTPAELMAAVHEAIAAVKRRNAGPVAGP